MLEISRSRSSQVWSPATGGGGGRAERAEASWQANTAGRALIEDSDLDLSRSSTDFDRKAGRAIRDWQGAVLDLVADEGMSKRSRARFMHLVSTVSGWR